MEVQLHIVSSKVCQIRHDLYLKLSENDKKEKLLKFQSIVFVLFVCK